MARWEKPLREERQQQRRRTPSFSSSLLDAIYHSIDESQGRVGEPRQEKNPAHLQTKKNNALEVEEEIACLRRAIMVEKWMESRTSSARSTRSRHMNSDSSSSTDSSLFSSSETESASKSTPKSSFFHAPTKAAHQTFAPEATPKHEGRFMRTKSRALKIYGDLKKVKQPISPGGKLANFLNSIFTSRNLKKHEGMEDWTSVKKSRSVKDSSPTCSLSSRSCLHRPVPPPSSRGKSKRSVRFCPVSVIVDEDCQPCGHKSIYDDNDPRLTPMPKINSHSLQQNIDSFRDYEDKKPKNFGLRGFYEEESDDGNSCTSSDLFELENIGIVGIGCHGAHREELPVYGTTNMKVNQAIANGLVM